MRFVMFYQSLVSDWNHGNAHFLRGVATELIFRGHDVSVYEPEDSWSYNNLKTERFDAAGLFRSKYPWLDSVRYRLEDLDLHKTLDGADVVIVHEWSDHALVKRIGEHRRDNASYRLFFHDTHHRSVTEPESMGSYDLSNYDGVLAFGEVITELYKRRCWSAEAWTWHEAADIRTFRPLEREKEGDLIWIGNWGDGERSAELNEFLIEPASSLRLKSRVYGVRYPDYTLRCIEEAGVEFAGWLPNFEVPRAFAGFKFTVHVPRRPYVEMLPGIPTIRVFEALACGIPLVSAPWDDAEGLFRSEKDFLIAKNGQEMRRILNCLAHDEAMRLELAANGRNTVIERHTCANRVEELFKIIEGLNVGKGHQYDRA